MRSRERLIEVLRSVNPAAVGRDVDLAFAHAALCIERVTGLSPIFNGKIETIARWNDSPHIRELATEVLFHDSQLPAWGRA